MPRDSAFTSFSTEQISVIVEPDLSSVGLQCAAMRRGPAASQLSTLAPPLLVRDSSLRRAAESSLSSR